MSSGYITYLFDLSIVLHRFYDDLGTKMQNIDVILIYLFGIWLASCCEGVRFEIEILSYNITLEITCLFVTPYIIITLINKLH